jgi:Domain of unknown function (DUF4192)
VRFPAYAASASNVGASVTTDLVPAVSMGGRRRTQRALELAEVQFVARVVADGGIQPWRSQIERRFWTAHATFSRRGRLSRGVAAGLLVALADPVTRDHCWRAVEAEPGAGWPAFWLQLSRRALPPYRSEPLFLLSWSAWRRGDLGLARTAAGAALVEDSGHRGAQLTLAMLGLCVSSDRAPSLMHASAAGAR